MRKLKKVGGLLISVLCLAIGLCFFSCQTGTEKSDESATGSISGKVFYSNAEDSSGIIVTLEKTDGLRSVCVISSAETGTEKSAFRSISGTTVSKSDGSYSFTGLEDGVYTVYAASTTSKEKAVYINTSITAGRSVTLDDLLLTATGSISGVITKDFETTGNEGFIVFVAGTSYSAITDTNGKYTISDVPAGIGYQVIVMRNSLIYILSSDVTVALNGIATMPDKNFTSEEISAGTVGAAGKDGISIKWLGSFSDASKISNPEYLDAYFNTTDGCSYIYDGTKWTLLAEAGKKSNTDDSNDDETIHVWNGEITKAATCTEDGEKLYVCEICGKEFTVVIPATGHSYAAEWTTDSESHWHAVTCGHTTEVSEKADHTWNDGVITKAVTCTEDGEKIYTCKVCGKTKTVVTSATGHTYASEWTTDSDSHWHAATCGHTTEVSEKAEHTWNDGVITKAATGHTYASEWTTDSVSHWHAATCSHTTEVSEKANHIWNDGVITKTATYTEEGQKVYTCKTCGRTKTETIEKLPPNEVCITVTIAANSDISVTKSSTDTTTILIADAGYDSYEWSSLGTVIGIEQQLNLTNADYTAGTYVFDLLASKGDDYYSASVSVTFSVSE